jgi:hypothetical protein
MPKKQNDSSRASTRRKPWVAPEITDEMLDRAVLRHGDSIFRRGPPALNLGQGAAPKPRKT